ncbi:hypothetical protein BUALT_BualtUnG0011500 [Buddleja alternifolia]|uniref:RING-type E3 ubiquitin transferase n=1 Tax=Buddleja alternifolia TaxID=168488 RepID=A0AAV6W3Q4_9LAMI|nr:hypothetical protein BUALT_BualtUnG0011500 [Buddleja alternifolia]
MEDFVNCQQSFRLYQENTFTTCELYRSSPSQFHMDFIFSCESFYFQWVLHQNSTNPRYERLVNPPVINNFIRVSLESLISNEPARRAIEETLKDWPISENWRDNFVDYVIMRAQDEVIKMPRHHNFISFEFKVVAIHEHVFNEGRAMNSMIQQSMEEDNDVSYLVPTAESSIESLEITRLTDNGTCSICLEDFPSNGDSDGACMPCSHTFHEDCIKKWLRTSHYCPVCRFEMPTS